MTVDDQLVFGAGATVEDGASAALKFIQYLAASALQFLVGNQALAMQFGKAEQTMLRLRLTREFGVVRFVRL